VSIQVPHINREQMVEVDRLMIEDYHISLKQMMEHAGENLARLASMQFRYINKPRILMLCGNGNNGGGGLVCARFLMNWGSEIQIFTVGREASRKELPSTHLSTLQRMGAQVQSYQETMFLKKLNSNSIVIDSMIGYGLKGEPNREIQSIIDGLNMREDIPVIALDAPSGLDVSGLESNRCLHAKSTLTLALPKSGLLLQENKSAVGQLFVADIGVPAQLYDGMGIRVGHIFAASPILQHQGEISYKPVFFND